MGGRPHDDSDIIIGILAILICVICTRRVAPAARWMAKTFTLGASCSALWYLVPRMRLVEMFRN